jgi:hypothetical protein
MPVTDIAFQSLIDWCNAAPPSPELVPKVGVYLRVFDTTNEGGGGSSLLHQSEGVLTFRSGRDRRFFPSRFLGTLRSITNPHEVATVWITLGQPTEDLVALSFVGGFLNGRFVEVDAAINSDSSDPKVIALVFNGERNGDSVYTYQLYLWATYSYVGAP